MKTIYNKHIISIFVVMLLFVANINISAQTNSYNDSIFHAHYDDEQIKDSTLLDKIQYNLFQGRLLYLQDKYDQALSTLLQYSENDSIIKQYPKEYANLAYMVSRVCSAKKDYENAYHLLNIAHQYNPKNTIYLSELAWFNLNIEEFYMAIDNYNKLIKLSPYKSDYYYYQSQAYMATKQYKLAMKSIEQYEQLEGESINILRAKIDALPPKTNLKKIINTINKYPTRNNSEKQAKYLLLSKVYNSKNMLDSCVTVLHRANDTYKNDPGLLYALATAYKSIEDEKNYEKYSIEAVMCNNINTEKISEIIRPTIAGMIQDQRNNEVKNLLNNIYNNNPQDSIILHFKSEVELALEDTTAAIATMYDIRKLYTYCPEIDDKLINLEQAQNNREAQITLANEGYEKYKNDRWTYYKIVSNLDDSINENTDSIINIGIELLDSMNNTPIKGLVCNILGTLKGQRGEYQHAIELLELSLTLYQDDANVYNNLAYYIALYGDDLKHAEKLAAKALEKDINSTSILDTYAWILYLQKDYMMAKFYFDKIIRIYDQKEKQISIVIAYHYGAILRKLNQKEESNKYWLMAIETYESDKEKYKEDKPTIDTIRVEMNADEQ